MSIENKAACELILNECLKHELMIPNIFYQKPSYSKAIVWDLDKTCDMYGSKSAAELSIGYMIENNSVIRENKNSFLEWIAKAQTKEVFQEEEKRLGELFRSAKISRTFCDKMQEYVVASFKPAGGMIDALHELLSMNYINFLNSGSFDFLVSGIGENVLCIRKEYTAGSVLGFDNDGYADGNFVFNIGKRKKANEEILMERNGFRNSESSFVSHISDDVASDKYYAKSVTNDGPFLWLSKENFAAGDVRLVIPPESRHDMTTIPKILRQYEFGRRIISARTVTREKELTYLAREIKENARRLFSENGKFEDMKKSVVRDAKKFMQDGLNKELYPAILSEAIKIEFEEERLSIKNSTENILDALKGTLEYNVKMSWLDGFES